MKFAAALERCGFGARGKDQALLLRELRRFSATGGFDIRYRGALDAKVICPNTKSTYENSEALYKILKKEYGAGYYQLFESVAEMDAKVASGEWSGYRVARAKAIVKKRYSRPRFDADGQLKYRTIVNNSAPDPDDVHGSLNDHCYVENFDKLELEYLPDTERIGLAIDEISAY